MTVSLWKAFLVLLVVRQSIVAWVNSILGTYCKGAVNKKGDNILAGIKRVSFCELIRQSERVESSNWCTSSSSLASCHHRSFLFCRVKGCFSVNPMSPQLKKGNSEYGFFPNAKQPGLWFSFGNEDFVNLNSLHGPSKFEPINQCFLGLGRQHQHQITIQYDMHMAEQQ